MRIVWSPLAIERIEEISDYIARDSPSAANRWIDAVFEKADILKDNPEIGRIVPELDLPSIRELVHGNYRVIYRLQDRQITILTVRSFRQILSLEDVERDG